MPYYETTEYLKSTKSWGKTKMAQKKQVQDLTNIDHP